MTIQHQATKHKHNTYKCMLIINIRDNYITLATAGGVLNKDAYNKTIKRINKAIYKAFKPSY